MKFNSNQFKRKSEYFLPFLSAFYFFKLGHKFIYKCDYLLLDGRRRSSYTLSIFYDCHNLRSVLITRFDELSFQTERQFFVSFLASCNYRQLATFICLVRDSYSLYGDSLYSLFIDELPHMVGDHLSRAALDYVNRK